MDYAPNGTLRQHYPKGTTVPPVLVASHVQQIASALQFAHDNKLVHRDIKPENMLLGQNREVLLSDFGLVSAAQSSTSLSTKEAAGTIHYMSPEQIQGKPRPASDQYALGVVAYEWLTGKRPFDGTYWEVMSQHLSVAPASLRKIVPSIPPELEEVVLVALNKDPHQRFMSVQAFAVAFQQACMPGSPVSPALTPAIPSFPATPVSPPVQVLSDNLGTFPVSAVERTTAVPAGLQDSDIITPVPSPSSVAVPVLPPRKLSRRAVFGTLAGLTVVGGGIAALLFQHYSSPVYPVGLNSSPTLVPPLPSPTHTSPSPSPTEATPAVTVTPSRSWSPLSSLPSPEADNTAVYVRLQQREYIYMSGGYHGKQYQSHYDSNLYRYDVASGQWEVVQQDFPIMINNAVAYDGQDQLFFTAGYSPNTGVTTLLYKYQLSTGTLQSVVPPNQVLFGFGSSMLADRQGHLYLTQGFMGTNATAQAGSGWYRYTIAQDQWNVLAPLRVGLGYGVLAFADQGSIVMIGGETDAGHYHSTAQIYRYTISNDTWKVEQAAAPLAFGEALSCPFGDGQIMILGGYDSTRDIALDKVWLVDLRTLNWRSLMPLPFGAARLGAAVSDNAGHVYVVRGVVNDADRPTQDFWQLS
jgi:serine/threonine protein kinase